jgi:hypothetical protein
MTNTSGRQWTDCLAYNAIRADDGRTDILVLIKQAMPRCVSEWEHFAYWYKRELGKFDAKTAQDAQTAGVESVDERFGSVLRSARTKQKISGEKR